MTARERLIDRAASMFLRSGIRTVTMDDIARETGVSKRTIYENFENKDALLSECLLHVDNIYLKESEELTKNADSTIFEVLGMMKVTVKALNIINPLFFSDLRRYHFSVWNSAMEINQERQRSKIFTILKKGVNQGLFRKQIHVEVVGKLLIEQLRIISNEDIFPELKYPPVLVFENVVVNFFRGISTQKGVAIIDKYLEEESDLFTTG